MPYDLSGFFLQAFHVFSTGWKLRIRVGGMCSEGELDLFFKLMFRNRCIMRIPKVTTVDG